MALITCPECGGKISDTVKSCIHCGYNLNPPAQNKTQDSFSKDYEEWKKKESQTNEGRKSKQMGKNNSSIIDWISNNPFIFVASFIIFITAVTMVWHNTTGGSSIKVDPCKCSKLLSRAYHEGIGQLGQDNWDYKEACKDFYCKGKYNEDDCYYWALEKSTERCMYR